MPSGREEIEKLLKRRSMELFAPQRVLREAEISRWSWETLSEAEK